jgi:hypothetical protein
LAVRKARDTGGLGRIERMTLVSVRAWVGGALLWAGVAMAARPGGQARDGNAALAEMKLNSGQVLIAAQIAEQCLEAKPNALECEVFRVRARARLGQCAALEPAFRELRASVWWDAPLALSEGMCSLRRGQFANSFAALEEAVVLLDKDPVPRFERAIAAMRAGWDEVAAADLDALSKMEQAAWMGDLLVAWQEIEAGDEGIDTTLALAERDVTVGGSSDRPHWALLQCRRWLELGDPFEAERVAKMSITGVVGQTRLAACRVEALRRAGDDPEAWFVLTRPWNLSASSIVLDAIRARVLVDRGELDEASALLDGVGEALDPDVVGSRWYLARAKGDQETQRRFEDQYRALTGRAANDPRGLLALNQVVPTQRAVPPARGPK